MKLFITLSKRNLAVITALTVIVLLISGSFYSAQARKIDGSTNALRVSYIKGLGYDVDETAISVKEITIPQEFGDVYRNYNALQNEAGFDLRDFRGKKATVYCYELSYDKEVNVHLLVSENAIIGGDVAEIEFSGEMKPLKKIN